MQMGKRKIWWSNATFFIMVHVLAVLGIYHKPWSSVPRATIGLWFLVWQFGSFGITIGYHRLWSHRSFRATMPTRIVLAALGSSAFQGSIKCSKSGGVFDIGCIMFVYDHLAFDSLSKLTLFEKRFTDDPDHDPYAATKGLLYSHMGWIFFKPNYPRLKLIESNDLTRDPIVRLQHKYYIPIAFLFGFVIPTLAGRLWGDPLGAFVWGGLASKLAIWHCTFLVNSLAHWHGLQPYSDENTSRGNLLFALLTGGEGNHNFHTFPYDFRAGPALMEWDPSKWVILILYQFGLAYALKTARKKDIEDARHYMMRGGNGADLGEYPKPVKVPVWTVSELEQFLAHNPTKCVVRIGKYAVDVTSYLAEHPGGSSVLIRYAVTSKRNESLSSTWAFEGGLNKHSRAARMWMQELRIAEIHECGEGCPFG